MKLFERVTNALKLITSIPISENTKRLNDVVISMDRKTNAELEKDALRKELLCIADDLDQCCKRIGANINVISKARCISTLKYLEGSVKESIRCKDLISGLLDFSR